MPGFMDVMRQRFGSGRLPVQGQMGQPSPFPVPQSPNMSPGMMDYGMPMDSGIVKPGAFSGGFEEYQEPTPQAPIRPMASSDQMAVRRPRRSMRPTPKVGQGGEPVF